jgi:hypothetical protein
MRCLSHRPRFDHSNYIWRRVPSYEVPHYVIFMNLLLFHSSLVQIFSSVPQFSNTLNLYIPLLTCIFNIRFTVRHISWYRLLFYCLHDGNEITDLYEVSQTSFTRLQNKRFECIRLKRIQIQAATYSLYRKNISEKYKQICEAKQRAWNLVSDIQGGITDWVCLCTACWDDLHLRGRK